MTYNKVKLLGDHKRLGNNTFWSYLLEKLDESKVQQAMNISGKINTPLDQLRLEQGKFAKMGSQELQSFINDLVIMLKEEVKSG